jgi:hypothetical protein
MVQPYRLSKEQLQERVDAYHLHGSQRLAAEALGVGKSAFGESLKLARELGMLSDVGEDETLLRQTCSDRGIAIDDVAYYWVKTSDVSMFVKRQGAMSYDDMRDAIIAEMDAHAPVYEAIEHIKGEHLLVVDPADVHVGKLSRILETGYDYDMPNATERVRAGITGLISKAQAFGVAKVVFVIGNDILHIDTPHRRTTSGTPQDTDGMWWEMFLEAKNCYVAIIEQLVQLADVHIIFCPSNHDYVSGWMLADTLYSWFRNHPNIHFGDEQRNISIAHRKYVEYGQNLMGFTHGDGAKEKDLPSLMQYEARSAWGRVQHCYMYVHHTHHKDRKVLGMDAQKREKDHIGVTVLQSGKSVNPAKNVYIETVRTPSPEDGWHDRNGYVNKQAVEVFLHHPTDGQVARFTHPF